MKGTGGALLLWLGCAEICLKLSKHSESNIKVSLGKSHFVKLELKETK